MGFLRAGQAALALLVLAGSGGAAPEAVRVKDDASLHAALRAAGPGTVIRIAPGRYGPGVSAARIRGTKERPVVLEGADPADPPVFEGGNVAIQLSACEHLKLANLVVRGQRGNGVNIDDGGDPATPSRHIELAGIRVLDIGPRGNCDGIKLSGADDFVVRDCRIEGWGGQGIDMVGCHRGLIEDCVLRGKAGFTASAGVQAKGGSRDIIVRRCRFEDAGSRAVNLGGSTGLDYFRPRDAKYEAKDITVEGSVFTGSQAPIAFVGVDGAIVRFNTILRPGKWILRILTETTEPGFAPCRNGRFERNLVVFRRAEVAVVVNVGPRTAPETFVFTENYWYCEDRPAESRPELPVSETGGVFGLDPRLSPPGDGPVRVLQPKAGGYGATALPAPAGDRRPSGR